MTTTQTEPGLLQGDRKSRRPGHFAGGLNLAQILLASRAYIALIVIIIVFSALSPNYFTFDNILVMTRHVAVNGILAIGMLLVILNAGIDLSVGSTIGLTGVVAGYMLKGVHVPIWDVVAYPAVWVVIVVSLAVGALVGWVNGVLVSRFKVAPFVATLGMLYVVRGIAMLITNGLTYPKLQGTPELGNTGFSWVGFNTLFAIPVGVIVMIVIAAAGSFLLNRTAFGRWVFASGGNERAAELSGVPVKKVQRSVYVIAGLCAAVAGLIIASELTSATPQTGTSFELTAIAAVVIGGASLMGGQGNIRGTLLGAFVIGFLSDGLVIILAVMLNSFQYKAKKAKTLSPRTDIAPRPAATHAATTVVSA